LYDIPVFYVQLLNLLSIVSLLFQIEHEYNQQMPHTIGTRYVQCYGCQNFCKLHLQFSIL